MIEQEGAAINRYAIFDAHTGIGLADETTFIDRGESGPGYIRIDAEIPYDRWYVEDGQIFECPDLVLSAEKSEFAVGEEIHFSLSAREGIEIPSGVQLLIMAYPSGLETYWDETMPIIFDEPGQYAARVFGPWPYLSNKFNLTISGGA